MKSFYVVIQYVPDPIANERINIGVITYDKHVTCPCIHYLKDWSRVQSFASGQDITLLQEFVSNFEHDIDSLPYYTILNNLEKMLEWKGCIQITRPRGSLLGVHKLAAEMASLMLIEPKEQSA